MVVICVGWLDNRISALGFISSWARENNNWLVIGVTRRKTIFLKRSDMDGGNAKNMKRHIAVEKPSDWPLNDFEDLLERTKDAVVSFMDTPGFETREVLVSLINAHDYNQQSIFGEDRISNYEVATLNFLFERSLMICLPSLRCFLYSFIGLRTRMQKMLHFMSKSVPELGGVVPLNIEAYENGLHPTLRVYYKIYQLYTVCKEHSFAEELCLSVEAMIYQNNTDCDCREKLDSFERAFTTIIHDISFSRGNKAEDIWFFDRNEILSIFSAQGKMLSILKKNPSQRPLRTMIMSEIGNFVLRSRNDYSIDCIHKYISEKTSADSFINNEIWMSSIERLNDSREGRVIKEVLSDDSWEKAPWFDNSISLEKKEIVLRVFLF